MKIEWQAGDIWGGRIVGRSGRSERWMIGYVADKYCFALVNMSDGMIAGLVSAEALAEQLNKSGEMPVEFLEPTGKAKGGHARAASLPPERRSEIASGAAKARWQPPVDN